MQSINAPKTNRRPRRLVPFDGRGPLDASPCAETAPCSVPRKNRALPLIAAALRPCELRWTNAHAFASAPHPHGVRFPSIGQYRLQKRKAPIAGGCSIHGGAEEIECARSRAHSRCGRSAALRASLDKRSRVCLSSAPSRGSIPFYWAVPTSKKKSPHCWGLFHTWWRGRESNP